MIRNIVFDMGNVLIRFDPDAFMTREKILDPEDRAVVMNEMFRSVEWALMDRGTLDEKTAEPLILSRIPEHMKEKTKKLLYQWAYPREMMDGMETLVANLKDAGYGIYLLSNASTAHHEYWPRFPVSRMMDGVLISADVHMIKPMDGIYQLFTERFRLKPEECLFIDDLPVNVSGAVMNGWQGIVYHGNTPELVKKLREMGIKI